jgi:hypothetical protein
MPTLPERSVRPEQIRKTGELFTIITPTIGRPTLDVLVETIEQQSLANVAFQLLLWDDRRHPEARPPESYNGPARHSVVLPPGSGRNGDAPGSPLRAIGLIAARTPWVTFADDDVCWEPNHLASLANALRERRWASTLRTIWTGAGERLGVDRFEAVGDDPTRGAPYETMDNNCVAFARELGVGAAWMYRETVNYNDDRLMYEFLKKHAGPRGRTDQATIHQICPDRLIDMFRSNCSAN